MIQRVIAAALLGAGCVYVCGCAAASPQTAAAAAVASAANATVQTAAAIIQAIASSPAEAVQTAHRIAATQPTATVIVTTPTVTLVRRPGQPDVIVLKQHHDWDPPTN